MIVVAYIINQLRKSGPVNVLYNLVCNLDYSQYQPIVVKLMKDDIDRSVTPQFVERGIEVIEFDFSFWELELRTSKVACVIEQCLKEKNVSIIHSHGYHPLLVSSYIKTNFIKLDTQHCFSLDSFKSSRGVVIGTYMHYRYLYRLKNISGGISISNSVKDYYESKNIGIPFSTVYNGIKVEDFFVDINEKQIWKKKLGLAQYKTLFCVVGHLSKLKDPLLVVKSYVSLLNQGYLKNSALVFCGSGAEESKCKELAKKYPQIIFKGYVFNVFDYLKAADVSICASHSEGFGLNYIEALIAGCLVLSSKIPAFNEFALIYPILQKYQFKKGCQTELENCLRLVESNFVDISVSSKDSQERFSAQMMGKMYMKLYDEYAKS